MNKSNYIIENPELADKPLNVKSLNSAMTACKLRDQFNIECQKRKLPLVPALPYVGFQDNSGLQYTGDKLDGFQIDCSDNEFLNETYTFFVLGTKGNLVSLLKTIGCDTMGAVNDHDLFKDMPNDAFNIVYKFGEAVQQLIDDGLIKVNKKASKPKKKAEINVISSLKVTSVKAAKKAPKKAAKKPSLNGMSKADLIALIQANS